MYSTKKKKNLSGLVILYSRAFNHLKPLIADSSNAGAAVGSAVSGGSSASASTNSAGTPAVTGGTSSTSQSNSAATTQEEPLPHG